jgi:hypothetical protein
VAGALATAVLAALSYASPSGAADAAAPGSEARQRELERRIEAQDARIRELERLLGVQAGAAAAAPVPPPAPASRDAAGQVPAAPEAVAPTASAEPASVGDVERTGRGSPRATETWGVYDPGDGFLIGRSDYGELDISLYAMGRYINQNDDDGVFTDHLGNVRKVDSRNDFFAHRVITFLKGWVGDPKLVYTVLYWTVNTTDQDATFGNIGYQFDRKFNLYLGLSGNPGTRSLMGSHPYWLGHDRVMADEFFRPYFGSGLWANGEVAPGLWYNVMLSNSNSALGVRASQLDRKMTSGASLWWMPTTHEFGPRGAYGDWENHDRVATRFGISAVQSPEQSFADFQKSPGNTTLRLADGVNLFETGSLAPGVTIAEADYRILSVDAGVKYRGAFLQAEFYERRLDGFLADGLLPVREIVDRGFQVQASFFPVPKVLEVYALTSQIYGDDDAGFGDSSEYVVGANWYPFDTRNHRWNLQLMDVNRSPVSSTFGYYTGGQDGFTLATSFSIFF